jgi:hypothetical protein
MPRAEAAIDVAAPLSLVWTVMTDLAAYGRWNPFIVAVDAPAGRPVRVGDAITLHVRFAGGRSVRSREVVTRLDEPSTMEDGTERAVLAYEFRGPLHAAGLVRAVRIQTLTRRPGGPTEYRTEEAFRGLLAFAVPLGSVRDGFERHARALKDHAEAR